jgi:hypothetical protein
MSLVFISSDRVVNIPGHFLLRGWFLILKGMKYFRLVPSTWVEHIGTIFDSIRNHTLCDRRLNKVCHGLKKCYRLNILRRLLRPQYVKQQTNSSGTTSGLNSEYNGSNLEEDKDNPDWCIIISGTVAQRGLCPPCSRGFLITHNDAPQSVGLLWTSDQLIAETSTWQLITHTTNLHAHGGIITHDRSRWEAVDLCLRPRGHLDRQTWLITVVSFLIFSRRILTQYFKLGAMHLPSHNNSQPTTYHHHLTIRRFYSLSFWQRN